MTHLEIIKEAYNKCGIIYAIKYQMYGMDTLWQYLILAGTEDEKKKILEHNLDDALYRWKSFMEFKNGDIASY